MRSAKWVALLLVAAVLFVSATHGWAYLLSVVHAQGGGEPAGLPELTRMAMTNTAHNPSRAELNDSGRGPNQAKPGFKFPWAAGNWEYRWGWHTPGAPALDIGTRGTNADKRILAAADGVITSICKGNLSARVVIDHDGTTLEYWHLDVTKLAAGVGIGELVVQGQELGVLRSGAWTSTEDGNHPCGEAPDQAADSAHLHWILPTNVPFTADGWTIQYPSSTWTRGSDVRNPHCDGCAYELLPSTNIPSAPVVAQKAGNGSGSVTSSPSGIDCGLDCRNGYPLGTSVTLTAVPNTGSAFSGWSGACTGSTGTCTLAVDGIKSVTATFAQQASSTYSLTAARAGDGDGAITGSGINCGSDCTESYASGTTVTLRASAVNGSAFSGWSGDCAGTGDCTLSMNAAKSVTATFTRQPSGTLAVSRVGNGSGWVISNPTGINCSNDCTEAYSSGTEVTLRASADPGSTFAGWGGACSGTGDCVLTMDSAKTVTATFNLIQSGCIPPATLINPVGIINTGRPEFIWKAQDFPAGYTVQVWAAGNPRNVLINQGPYSDVACSTEPSVCRYPSPRFLPSGNYVWRLYSSKLNDTSGCYSISAEVTFTVAMVCDYTLSGGATNFGAGAGTSSLSVQTTPGCEWDATSNNPDWIWVSPGSGNGSGSVTYGVLANYSSSRRSGSITVGGRSVEITQSANDTFTVGQFSPGPGYTINSGRWFTGDFNGDGKGDLIHLTNSDYVHPWLSRGDGTFDVRQYGPGGGYNIQSGTWLVGDFNGDGRTDLLHVTDADYVHPWLSNGDGTFSVTAFQHAPRYNNRSGRWLAADINGDGRTDLVHLLHDDYIHPWLSNGNGTFDVKQFRPRPGYAVDSGTWMTGDLNGDGRMDLIHKVSGYTNAWLSNGDGTFLVKAFNPWPAYDLNSGRWLTGDFNGDGKGDLVHITNSNYINTWFSNGDGEFSVRMYQPRSGYLTSPGRWVAGDLDADGKTDLVHIVGGDYVHPWLSRGNGDFAVSTFSPRPGYIGRSGAWMVVDLNGDKKADLVHRTESDYVHPWISNASEATYYYVLALPGISPCPGCPLNPGIKVWANTPTRRYHCAGTHWYGRTRRGQFMTQKQAQDSGYRAAWGEICR